MKIKITLKGRYLLGHISFLLMALMAVKANCQTNMFETIPKYPAGAQTYNLVANPPSAGWGFLNVYMEGIYTNLQQSDKEVLRGFKYVVSDNYSDISLFGMNGLGSPHKTLDYSQSYMEQESPNHPAQGFRTVWFDGSANVARKATGFFGAFVDDLDGKIHECGAWITSQKLFLDNVYFRIIGSGPDISKQLLTYQIMDGSPHDPNATEYEKAGLVVLNNSNFVGLSGVLLMGGYKDDLAKKYNNYIVAAENTTDTIYNTEIQIASKTKIDVLNGAKLTLNDVKIVEGFAKDKVNVTVFPNAVLDIYSATTFNQPTNGEFMVYGGTINLPIDNELFENPTVVAKTLDMNNGSLHVYNNSKVVFNSIITSGISTIEMHKNDVSELSVSGVFETVATPGETNITHFRGNYPYTNGVKHNIKELKVGTKTILRMGSIDNYTVFTGDIMTVNGGLEGSCVYRDGLAITIDGLTGEPAAYVAPSSSAASELKERGYMAFIHGTLTFGANSAYKATIDPTALDCDLLQTHNLNIDANTALEVTPVNDKVLPNGTEFKIAIWGSITGTWNGVPFKDLADGTVFTAGLNKYRINYQAPTPATEAKIILTVVDSNLVTSDFNEMDLAYKVYPNPTVGLVTVSLATKKATTFTVEITNLAGAVVKHFKNERADGAFEKSIDLRGLSSGVYMVSVVNKSGSMTNKLVIK